MRLSAMMPDAPWEVGADPDVTSLAFDTRRVAPGALFFCVPGFTADGHDFAGPAIERGAVAVVVERPLGLGVPEVRVPSVRAAMATAAARFFGDPSDVLDVVGITGTNGKTTSAFMLRDILEGAGRPCGLLGTVKSIIGGRERPVQRTTPEAIDLQADLRAMLDGGDVACAMEVSSHALELGRADAVRFAAALFTNLRQDHLDFHADMETYFQAKRRLFCERAPRAAIVNVDDRYGRRLAAELPGALTFGSAPEANWRIAGIAADRGGSSFTVHTPDGEVGARLSLPGGFNVLNAVGAAAAAHRVGLAADEALGKLAAIRPVPGRLEPVEIGQPFAVLVDYAHTPDSLAGVLSTARGLGDGRLICVFGCGGDRDRAKRPLMGAAATANADRVIVTSDNPRSEDPEAIVQAILAGAGPTAERVLDRREAIARALGAARADDVVVIAGKGHEQGQELANGVTVPFDDVSVARELLGDALGGRG